MKPYKIKLWKNQPAFQTILSQEKIQSQWIEDFSEKIDADVLIINDILPQSDLPFLSEYLKKGGCVLTNATVAGFFLNQAPQNKHVSTLFPQPDSYFRPIEALDLHTDIQLLPINRLDHGLNIMEKQIGEGLMLIFPFDLNTIYAKQSCKRKKFYDLRKELPSERVSCIEKNQFRLLVRLALSYLLFHHQKRLLIVTPTPAKNVFIFRIDTDFCSLNQAKQMYALCQQYDIHATWFVDTGSEENLSFYASLQQQEIGLHCATHLVYETIEENRKNLNIGLEKLQHVNITPSGFAAPFGEWNENLQTALEETGFLYSSDFCYDYDNLPSYPFSKKGFSSVLQIPIHPISVGRLRRSHYSDQEKISYYQRVIDRKLAFSEPILLYHHPHHQMWSVWEAVFQYVKEKNITNMTMLDFYHWWKNREIAPYKISLKEGNQIKNEMDYPIRMMKNNQISASIRSQNIDLTEIRYHEIPRLNSAYVQRMKRFHWRELLYDWEHKRSKKRI